VQTLLLTTGCSVEAEEVKQQQQLLDKKQGSSSSSGFVLDCGAGGSSGFVGNGWQKREGGME